MRELGLDPDAQSRAFSNFLLPLGAEGPKGAAGEQQLVELRSSYPAPL